MTSVTIDGVESSDSPYLTITAVQKQFENTVSEVEEEEVQMPCKIDIELECAVPGCNFGGQGTNYKTPALEPTLAMEMLKIHRADAHGLGGAESVYDCDAQVEALPEPVCQAVLHRGCSVEEFKSFTVDWDKFAAKYSSWFTEQPGEEDEYMLNDLLNYHLLACIPAPMETAIRTNRSNTVDKIPTADILMDIKMFIVREGVGCASDHDVQVDAVPETVCRPVLPMGCSVEQFKSFHMAWSSYAEEFRSQFEETYREVDEVRLKYLLNYELLSSIPTSMEHAIYRARAFMVDRVPTATLLLDIKRITVGEAVKRAQQAVVRNIDEVTEAGVETVIDEVAKDNTGGQGGGAKETSTNLCRRLRR